MNSFDTLEVRWNSSVFMLGLQVDPFNPIINEANLLQLFLSQRNIRYDLQLGDTCQSKQEALQ